MSKRLSLILLSSILFFQLFAESVFIEKLTLNLQEGEIQNIELPKDLSSLAFKSNKELSLLKIQLNNEIIEISNNVHLENNEFQVSNLIFPSEVPDKLTIQSEENTVLEIFILKVPPLNLQYNGKSVVTDSCEKPQGIDQDVWRAGLPPPTVTPSLNQVNHCIVHHSAGSNTATDFTEVVRNIYLYHTDVNGWDDIGYNYLIAPDGTLFHGRDGLGQISDDNVRGAHYCAKNTGTMGVCILGDYTVAVPQLAALEMLEDLLLWKLNKESLNPGDSARHPVPGGAFLGRVAGHQDGCATACPGTFLYADIPGIIDSLESRIADCPTPSSLGIEVLEKSFKIYPQPAKDYVIISSDEIGQIFIYDHLGKEILRKDKKSEDFRININAYPRGTYYIKLLSRDRQIEGKLFIYP